MCILSHGHPTRGLPLRPSRPPRIQQVQQGQQEAGLYAAAANQADAEETGIFAITSAIANQPPARTSLAASPALCVTLQGTSHATVNIAEHGQNPAIAVSNRRGVSGCEAAEKIKAFGTSLREGKEPPRH